MKRAESIREFLIGLGVEPHRLQAIGFGKSRPLSSAHGHKSMHAGGDKNRRVEIVLVQNGSCLSPRSDCSADTFDFSEYEVDVDEELVVDGMEQTLSYSDQEPTVELPDGRIVTATSMMRYLQSEEDEHPEGCAQM